MSVGGPQNMFKRKVKDFGVDNTISTFVVPIVSLVIGVLFSNVINSSLQETIIISLLLMIFLSFVEHSVRDQSRSTKMIEKNEHLETKIDELKIFAEIKALVLQHQHPYFKEWGLLKLEKFIEDNESFYKGTHRTTPQAEDTFGIAGIRHTNEYGSLKCLSSVSDYWDDDFSIDYLKVQHELIEKKKVHIQRVFVLSEQEYEKYIPLFEKQTEMGIEVHYIFKENRFVNHEWLKEDYLIQDDALLVEISMESHEFREGAVETEVITLCENKVNKKIKRFYRILDRATRYQVA